MPSGGSQFGFAQATPHPVGLARAVVTTTNGKGIVAEDHPLSLGAGAHLASIAEWVTSRDVLLEVRGTDFGPLDLWNGPWTIEGTLVRIDIDPRQIGVNARPDIALVNDAAAALRSLLHLVGDQRPETGAGVEAREWASRTSQEAAAEGALWISQRPAGST